MVLDVIIYQIKIAELSSWIVDSIYWFISGNEDIKFLTKRANPNLENWNANSLAQVSTSE